MKKYKVRRYKLVRFVKRLIKLDKSALIWCLRAKLGTKDVAVAKGLICVLFNTLALSAV